jgi:hypothetical protein
VRGGVPREVDAVVAQALGDETFARVAPPIESPQAFAATFVPTIARDIVVLGACITVEQSSLPAFFWLWRNRARLWAKRREIQEKKRRRSATSGTGIQDSKLKTDN